MLLYHYCRSNAVTVYSGESFHGKLRKFILKIPYRRRRRCTAAVAANLSGKRTEHQRAYSHSLRKKSIYYKTSQKVTGGEGYVRNN